MTHNELLKRLNDLPEAIGLAEFKHRHDALLAVVELHNHFSNAPYCVSCSGQEYPCPTIQAIEKELSNG